MSEKWNRVFIWIFQEDNRGIYLKGNIKMDMFSFSAFAKRCKFSITFYSNQFHTSLIFYLFLQQFILGIDIYLFNIFRLTFLLLLWINYWNFNNSTFKLFQFIDKYTTCFTDSFLRGAKIQWRCFSCSTEKEHFKKTLHSTL